MTLQSRVGAGAWTNGPHGSLVVSGLPSQQYASISMQTSNFTVPAQSTAYYTSMSMTHISGNGVAFSGSYNVTVPYQFRAVYASPVAYKEKIGTLAQNWIINSASGNPNSATWTPNPYQILELDFTDAPSLGIVDVGATATLTATLQIGTITTDLPLVEGFTAQWTTANPGDFMDGGAVVVSGAGRRLGQGVIVKDGDGNFHVTINMGAPLPDDPTEELEEIAMPDPQLPQTPADTTGPKNELGGVATPSALPGTDPAAATPGTAIHDNYAATRAGVRDALNSDVNSGADLDLTQPSDLDGNIVGEAAEKVSTAIVPSVMTAPGAVGNGNLAVTFLGFNWSLGMPDWLKAFRPWFEFLINLLGVMALIRLSKTAFA